MNLNRKGDSQRFLGKRAAVDAPSPALGHGGLVTPALSARFDVYCMTVRSFGHRPMAAALDFAKPSAVAWLGHRLARDPGDINTS
jgi:hypothetical protein